MFDEIAENRILVITWNDKISYKLISSLRLENPQISIVIDKSLTLLRVLKLFFKKNSGLTLPFLYQSLVAELKRKKYSIPKTTSFQNKDQLSTILSHKNPDMIIVFRGTFIFPKDIINNYKLINVHCADITNNSYRGLGAVYKSFICREQKPKVTVHAIETKIDSGKVLFTKDYKFNFDRPYSLNENIAYETGIQCISKIVN